MAGEQWRKMTDEEKQPYDRAAQEDKARYHQELANETAQNGGEPCIHPSDAKKQNKQNAEPT